jgi:hypothetical protein
MEDQMADIPANIGDSEDDMDAPGMEKDQGDGSNLSRPDVKSDGSKSKTDDALDKLGKGKPYGHTKGGDWI